MRVEPLLPPVGRIRRWLQSHERAVDVLLAAAVVVGALPVLNLGSLGDPAVMVVPPSAYGSATALLVGASATVAGAAVLVRRRHPLVAACTLTVSVASAWPAVHYLAPVSVAVAAYTAVRYARSRQAVGWLVAQCLVTFAVCSFCSPVRDLANPVYIRADQWLTSALLALTAGAVGLLARRTRVFEQQLVCRAERHVEQQSRFRSALALAEERRRIAGELHDVVSHSLTVMVNLCDGALAARAGAPEAAWRAVEHAAATGRSAGGEMRALVDVLRADDAPPSAPTGLDLDFVVASVRAAGLPVAVTVNGPRPSDPAVRLAVSRIVQEALTNTLKHAVGATQATVHLETTDGRLAIRVADDGRTCPDGSPVTGGGYGILGMRERVTRLGGSFDAGPSEHGWLVAAHLVVAPAAEVVGSP